MEEPCAKIQAVPSVVTLKFTRFEIEQKSGAHYPKIDQLRVRN